VPVEQVKRFETSSSSSSTRARRAARGAGEKKAIDDTIKAELNQALEEFGKSFAGDAAKGA
jgi:histone H3/H4